MTRQRLAVLLGLLLSGGVALVLAPTSRRPVPLRPLVRVNRANRFGTTTDAALLRYLQTGTYSGSLASGTSPTTSKGGALTFTRASSATCIDGGGVRQTLSANQPCIEAAGLRVEPSATNFLLNSGAPATQTVTLSTGTYTAWLEGLGTPGLSLAVGTAVATGLPCSVTKTAPCVFSVTTGGTVTGTVSGSVTLFQLENSPGPTSYIPTTGTSATRALEVASVPNGLTAGSPWCVSVYVTPGVAWASSNTAVNRGLWQFGSPYGIANSAFSYYFSSATKWTVDVFDTSVAQKATTVTTPPTAGAHRVKTCNAAGVTTVAVDGVLQAVSTSGTGSNTMASQQTTLYLGNAGTSGAQLGGWLQDVCEDGNTGVCQ